MLFNPASYTADLQADETTRKVMLDTIRWFEDKGLKKIKEDDQAAVWYDDFLDFLKRSGAFAVMLTPAGYGTDDSRWDMFRIAEYNEILAFYGLCYWYAWQVSILGLGPIWMGNNEAVKHRAAQALAEGGVFAFGLSEQTHGADIYSTEMNLTPRGDGAWLANGSKYYIGNGNCAAMVSTFGKFADSGDYVFFVVQPDHPAYECVKKIDTSGVRQAYVAEYKLTDYPITEADILCQGKAAWDAALSTINVGKFELGCAAIGMAEHCFFEALNHAGNRELYGRLVTDFGHVRRTFTEALARIAAMKLVSFRAADYMRSASAEDRRYLLYNPIVKMKVTGQGTKVIDMLHSVIAAKGYEQDTYFEMAIREIGMLPRLEGTEHVNMALIIKFVRNYFFGLADMPDIPQRDDPADDGGLFSQATGGLAKVTFGDWRAPYQGATAANVKVFRLQAELFREWLMTAPPDENQARDVDYMLAAGELFTLIAYAQLILENAALSAGDRAVDDDLLDQIFEFLVADFSAAALNMITRFNNSDPQEELFRRMLKKPVLDEDRFNRVWNGQVWPLKDSYVMSD